MQKKTLNLEIMEMEHIVNAQAPVLLGGPVGGIVDGIWDVVTDIVSPGEAGSSMEDVIMTNYTGINFYEGNCSPDNPCQVPYDNGMSGLFDNDVNNSGAGESTSVDNSGDVNCAADVQPNLDISLDPPDTSLDMNTGLDLDLGH